MKELLSKIYIVSISLCSICASANNEAIKYFNENCGSEALIRVNAKVKLMHVFKLRDTAPYSRDGFVFSGVFSLASSENNIALNFRGRNEINGFRIMPSDAFLVYQNFEGKWVMYPFHSEPSVERNKVVLSPNVGSPAKIITGLPNSYVDKKLKNWRVIFFDKAHKYCVVSEPFIVDRETWLKELKLKDLE